MEGEEFREGETERELPEPEELDDDGVEVDPLLKPKKDLIDTEDTESLDDLEEDELDEDEESFDDVNDT